MSAQPQRAPAGMAWRGWLLRPRFLGAVLVVALAALHLLANTPIQSWLRNAWFDAYQIMMPRSRVSAPAVIVAVDEKSLAQLGQWPWPRTLIARVFDRLAEYRPLAVGVDVIFAEPDRLSPGAIAENNPHVGRALALQLKRLLSNDDALAAAIKRLPVVLGVAGLDERGTEAPPRSAAVFRMQGDPLPYLWHFPSALASLKQIDAAATSRALLSADIRHGVVRRIPLLAAVGNAPFPSLSLETLRVGVGAPAFSVRTGAHGIESIGIGDVLIRSEADGHLWVRFGRHDPARFVSATDVIAGTVDREHIAGKLVLFGVTGIGLLDQQATPLGERMSGMEIHAQVLENIFDGNLLMHPYWMRWAETALIAVLGALLVLAVPVLSPVRSSLVLIAVTGGLLVLGMALFRYAGVLLDAAAPVIDLNVLFGGLLRATLAESARQQERLKRELEVQREAAARMAGELEAARRVQIGMLPVPAFALQGERRFDLHASMEPAREVGGDLYDFFMVGRSRLFFMVGDVSGKGMPASIFMALSKALYKSAALRSLPDLGRTMAEANVEITRENPEFLFVTAVACMLDVETGELAYCNAGHEPPHAIAADGKKVRQLEGGGPPLCTLENFPYQTAHARMAPGESLVLVSDGVPEAMNPAGELFGRARLARLLGAMPAGLSAEKRVKAVNDEVHRFSAGAEMADDVTILVVRWRGNQ
ncbi:MAG TPA: CHASE2 domain-containing protein [Burkholderiales bacterium]|nr:CHASE2 domain-containing protein [Burkholderiales bacterium]